ncbi:hypothetical protein PY32053_00854 [Paracoccus yeei]|uniref:Uncharacterized protein n=1 Tax=Paracoccus yeei TaxID=147645 RepID=A0A386UJK7_9RHOB|nr:hypothetical protein PY32053_00854 [Paracoccus yeei]
MARRDLPPRRSIPFCKSSIPPRRLSPKRRLFAKLRPKARNLLHNPDLGCR